MRDLEDRIADWRRQMTATGIKDPAALDELESHLREDVERRIQSGCPAPAAFDGSVESLGRIGALCGEFQKVAAMRRAQQWNLRTILGAAGVAGSGLWYLRHTWIVLKLHLSLMDSLFAITGLILIALCLFSIPFRPAWLPVPRNSRLRFALALLCVLSGPLYALDPGHWIGVAGSGVSMFLWRTVPYLTVVGFAMTLESRPSPHRGGWFGKWKGASA